MSAAALDQLRQGGFILSLVPGTADRLLIKPLSKVTSEVRELIGSNRAAIVASLTAEAANDGHLTELPPAPNPEPPSVRTPAPPPAPARRTYALPDRELDWMYLRHHWSCPTCVAAGKRGGTRCAVGLTYNLVAAGQTLPMP